MFNKILCIDDDPITLMLCKKVIANSDFAKEIVTARNGVDALAYFKELIENKTTPIHPEVIFLDLNMPIMDGWEFLDELTLLFSKAGSKIKVYILSSTIDPKDIDKSKKYQIVENFLSKPITKEILNSIKK